MEADVKHENAADVKHENAADVKHENAAELGHLIHQLEISPNDRHILSEFLRRDDKESIGAYNLKLQKFKDHLKTIPNSEEFFKALKPITLNLAPSDHWQRHYPIEKTPKTHFIHAEYRRIPPKSMISFRGVDPFYGKEMPYIFYRATNIMGFVDDKVEEVTKIYYIIKPFGYDFADIIESDGMKFKLLELYNPQYVCLTKLDSKYKGSPKPIIIDGRAVKPISNAEYTLNYKRYLRKSIG